jgi:hypothetical protein
LLGVVLILLADCAVSMLDAVTVVVIVVVVVAAGKKPPGAETE